MDTLTTPNTERRRIENDKLADEWSVCCSRSNKEFVKFATQIGFGASVLVFSMIQISRPAVKNKEIYFSMLSGTLGLFLPHPTMASKNDF